MSDPAVHETEAADQPAPAYDARYGYRDITPAATSGDATASVIRRMNLQRVIRCILLGLEGVPAGGVVLDAPAARAFFTKPLARAVQWSSERTSPARCSTSHGSRDGARLGAADLERPPFRAGIFDASSVTAS